MAQFTYPGVYREEILTQRRVIQDVSTANYAVVGFFKKGPVNEPVLVTDFEEVTRIFGDFTTKSIAPTSLAAYYSNGGQNAYIVRVVGDGAAKSVAAFADEVRNEDSAQTSTGGGSPDALSFTASNVPISPGSVRVLFTEDTDVTAEVIGVGDGVATVFPFALANAPVLPGSFSSTDSTEAFTDNGDGTLTGGSGGSGTIDYSTGVGSLTFNAAPSGAQNITADYTFAVSSGNALLANVPLIETFASETASQLVYHGSLNQSLPVYYSVEFVWIDQGTTTRTATVDSSGLISGDATGTLDLLTGDVVLNVGANPVETGGAIVVSYYYYDPLEAADDGAGALTVAGGLLASAGTVDYELGDIAGTTVNLDAVGTKFYLDYDQDIHPSEAKNEGVSGDDLRLTLTVDENFLDVTTGIYDKFSLAITEIDSEGNETSRGTFSEVVLDDLTDVNHISQLINDPFRGSDLVEMVVDFSTEVPTGLSGSVESGVLVNVSAGTDAAMATSLPLGSSRGIVPGTLVITYASGGNTRTVTDDAQGGLTGDVNISSTASIDYETGALVFRPSLAPTNATNVEAAYTLLSESESVTAAYSGGSDGAAISRSDVTDFALAATNEGIYALDSVDELLILSVPDFAGDSVAEAAQLAYVAGESRRDSMVLLAPPEGASLKQAIDYKLRVLASSSNRGAMYWPWIQIEDPINGRTINVPPHGHVSGIWSRTDSTRNVGKAPAGVNDGALTYLLGFEQELSGPEVGQLNQVNINALWQPPRQSRSVWGARTLEVGGEFRYIQKRRTIDFISVAVARSMWWAVFENIGPSLFVPIRQQIEGFLRRQFLQGVLAGTSSSEAYFVKVDSGNNPPEVTEQGQVIVDYGVATNTPGEFIRLRHRQITG